MPSAITRIVASGNILHTTNREAGYAAWQIPGVAAGQYSLSGNCSGPVSWNLNWSTLPCMQWRRAW